MKSKWISLIGFLAVLFLISIGSESRASGQYNVYLPVITHDTFVIPPPIIPPTTKALPDTTTQYLTSVSPNGVTYTFSQTTPELQALDVGDIMVGDVAIAAPDGFLRKVVSISTQGGDVIVTTADTVLEEAIEQGGFVYNTTLSPASIASSTQLEGVTLDPNAGTFFININNVVLYDADSNPNTTNDQITANGSVELEPGLTFSLSVEDFVLEELYFAASIEETADIEISSVVTLASLQAEIVLAQYYLTPFVTFIGPIPVVFTPVLIVNVGMDGSIHIGVTASATQQATYTAGLQYKNSAWNPINNLTNSFQYSLPTLTTGLDVKVYAGAELSLLLYGVVGPDAEAQAYLDLEANPLATPWWVLYGGLDANIGVEFEILSHVIAGYQATVLNYRVVLAQASVAAWVEAGAGSASGGGISNSAVGAYYPSLAIAPNGDPYAVWVDPTTLGDSEIYIKTWNGNGWGEVGAGSASGGGISLTMSH